MAGEHAPLSHPPIGGTQRNGESRKVPCPMNGRAGRNRPHQRQNQRGLQRTPWNHRVPTNGEGPPASLVRITIGAIIPHASGIAARGALLVAMSHNRGRTAAVWAALGLDLDAQVQQFQRARLKETAELHQGTLPCHASRHYARCHKLPFSIRRSYQCSTALTPGQKPLFKPFSITKIGPWNIFAGLTLCFGQTGTVSVRQKTTRFSDQWMEIHIYLQRPVGTGRARRVVSRPEKRAALLLATQPR